MSSQRLLLTRLPSRDALRAHEAMRMRHMGHSLLAMSTVLVKHDLHTSCAHGIVTGSTTMLRHTGQVTSDSVNDDSSLLLPLPLSGDDKSRLRRGAIRNVDVVVPRTRAFRCLRYC